ncbi:hypothetical protein AHAS_Ahas16G0005300 [Arachis hypogaea]
MSTRRDPAPEATIATLLMMARTASYVAKDYRCHHSALALLIQVKKKHRRKKVLSKQKHRW